MVDLSLQVILGADDVTHGTVKKWHAVTRRPHFDAVNPRRGRHVSWLVMCQSFCSYFPASSTFLISMSCPSCAPIHKSYFIVMSDSCFFNFL